MIILRPKSKRHVRLKRSWKELDRGWLASSSLARCGCHATLISRSRLQFCLVDESNQRGAEYLLGKKINELQTKGVAERLLRQNIGLGELQRRCHAA